MKKIIKKFFKYFQRKIPINIPVYYGDLLTGRVALVTGGSSGIGFAISKIFLINGASVVIAGRDEEKLKKAQEKLIKYAKEENFCSCLKLDITNINDIKNKIQEIISKYKIDILVNNAGIGIGDNIGNTRDVDFDKVIDTNLKGTYFLTQEIYNYYVKEKIKGNILNISSSSAIRPAVSPYSITKSGIVSLTKGLAKKAIENEIVVNGLAPGPTATDMIKGSRDNLNSDKNPSNRLGTAEEVANLALILVSDMGKLIVGDTIYATGGAGIVTYDDVEY